MLSLAMPAPTQLSHPGVAHALRGEGQRGFVRGGAPVRGENH
jgi:hypothetical protein